MEKLEKRNKGGFRNQRTRAKPEGFRGLGRHERVVGYPADRRPEEPPGNRTRVLAVRGVIPGSTTVGKQVEVACVSRPILGL